MYSTDCTYTSVPSEHFQSLARYSNTPNNHQMSKSLHKLYGQMKLINSGHLHPLVITTDAERAGKKQQI